MLIEANAHKDYIEYNMRQFLACQGYPSFQVSIPGYLYKNCCFTFRCGRKGIREAVNFDFTGSNPVAGTEWIVFFEKYYPGCVV